MPRGKKEGSVFYNKNRDNWTAQYYYKDIKTGKSKKKSKSLPTKELAERYLDTVMYQRQNPIYIKKHKICLGDLMNLRTKNKLETNTINENSLRRINNSIEIIKQSYLYKTKIDDITSNEIQEFLNTLTDYSNSVIKKVYSEFSQIFNYAFNHGYILANPMIDVIKPKSKNKTKVIRALTVDEQAELSKYLKKCSLEECKFKNIFLIQMFMGLRIGEVLALKISDIDLLHNKVNITKTLTRNKKGIIIMGDSTKTYAGTRELPIPDFLKPYFNEQMQVAMNTRKKLLFQTESGNYISSSTVSTELKELLSNIFNIEDISTHSLRHTYGTRCVEGGMRAVALQRLMGHTDIRITLNTYTDVFNKFKESEIEKVNEYYLNNSIIKNKELQAPKIVVIED